MARLRRLLRIARVCRRHRLDTFIPLEQLPLPLRLMLRPVKVGREPELPRGLRLRLALEELGPIFVKFGQILSTRPDLIPPDVVAELDHLQDNVAPFDSEVFIAIVERALGAPVDQLFARFDREPLASASVAQVHTAMLADGREVVVKAIRPGIDRIIRQDIALLRTLAELVERYAPDGRRLHPVEIVEDYRHTIEDELNLQREGANTAMLRRHFEYSPLLYVPEVHWPYTNEKVLVTERIYATPVTDVEALREQGTDFRMLAENGVEIFFTQVFEHNFFHADMHPGNIFVDASNPRLPRYLAIDCAIMGTLSDEDQYYLARNLLAIFRRDYRLVAELHVQSGWVPEGTSINDFAAAIRTVTEPVFDRPLKDISFAEMLINLFQTARRFDMEVQPSLVLLQKTLLNIEGLGRQLYPDLDLWATAQPFLERWLKERYRPGALVEQARRYGPDWLEQLPHIPQLVYQSLEQLRSLDRTIAQLNPDSDIGPENTGRKVRLLGAASIGAGLGVLFPHWLSALSGSAVAGGALLLLGAGLLWLR